MSSRQAERHGAAHASRSGPRSQRRRIVASKLAAPPRRPGIVDRPALLAGLDRVLGLDAAIGDKSQLH